MEDVLVVVAVSGRGRVSAAPRHEHPRVPDGVTRQVHEQHPLGDMVQGVHPEALPPVGAERVLGEARPVLPLAAAVTPTLQEARRAHRPRQGLRRDVHLRGGEVGEAADVVEIQVGEHDVPHVPRIQAQGLYAADRRLALTQCRAQDVARGAEATGRVGDVRQPDPRVHQHEAARRLYQQHARGGHTRERPAVHLVDPHERNGTVAG